MLITLKVLLLLAAGGLAIGALVKPEKAAVFVAVAALLLCVLIALAILPG